VSDQQPKPRATRSDKGRPRKSPETASVPIEITLLPDNLAWARKIVASGLRPSISQYINVLIAVDKMAGGKPRILL
jgi:hypothetical protein